MPSITQKFPKLAWRYIGIFYTTFSIVLTSNCQKNHVKNPGTDSIFEFLMDFKRDLNLLEKSDKFSKFHSWLDVLKSEFIWVHFYVRFRVTKQVPNGLVRIKEMSLNLKFNPYNISWTVKLAKISFKLPN